MATRLAFGHVWGVNQRRAGLDEICGVGQNDGPNDQTWAQVSEAPVAEAPVPSNSKPCEADSDQPVDTPVRLRACVSDLNGRIYKRLREKPNP